MMLNLAQANAIVSEWSFSSLPIRPIIKHVLSSILASYTDEEWKERCYSKVRYHIIVILVKISIF